MGYKVNDLVKIKAGSTGVVAFDPMLNHVFMHSAIGTIVGETGSGHFLVAAYGFGDRFPNVVLAPSEFEPYAPAKPTTTPRRGLDFPKHEGWPGDDPAHQRLLGYLHALDETHAIGGDRKAVYAVCNFLEHLGHKEVADKFRVFFP